VYSFEESIYSFEGYLAYLSLLDLLKVLNFYVFLSPQMVPRVWLDGSGQQKHGASSSTKGETHTYNSMHNLCT